MNRRKFLLGASALAASGLSIAAYRFWPESGFNNPCLTGMPDALKQHTFMQQIWAGIDATQVWDCHVHLAGTGDSVDGVWMSPNMNSLAHPILKLQKQFYMNGGCTANGKVDASYVQRLAQLSSEMPIGFKSMLFAFDWFHDENGRPTKDNSIFYIANDYVASVASKHSQYFEWVASIHPYRADALDALDKAHANGARAIKWLPSGMGIDPASSKCNAFYKKLNALNIPIISHTGAESAVQGGNQAHGNPLRMRRALDAGVRVALAHCASDGHDEDLDNGNKRIKSFNLFTRLMDTPDYKALVFGEISAITLINHAWAVPKLLEREDWQMRLLNGSDYPLPGIFPLINLPQLVSKKLLLEDQVPFLKAVKEYNPLLFDFAVKRLITHDSKRFSAQVFETRRFFNQES